MAHDLRKLLRMLVERAADPSAAILDGRTLQSTPESGARAGYDGYKRKKGSKVHIAVDTLGHLLALITTPANEQERAQVAALARDVQAACGRSVQIVLLPRRRFVERTFGWLGRFRRLARDYERLTDPARLALGCGNGLVPAKLL